MRRAPRGLVRPLGGSLGGACRSSSQGSWLALLGRAAMCARDLRTAAEEQSPVDSAASHHRLEKELGDTFEAVRVRRERVAGEMLRHGRAGEAVFGVPATREDFDVEAFYDQVHGSNCENVIGFVPLPVGVIGPLVVNGESYTVPLATTEGALLASTNRGARAIQAAGGARCVVTADGMTRSPVLALPSAVEAAEFKAWLEAPEQLEDLRARFGETTSFGRLESVQATIAGRYVYARFRAVTGDAMGMNMVGKGVNHIMMHLLEAYPSAKLISLSSNMCTDKKPSAINWTQGRGKSVVAEVTLPREVVEGVLKTTISDLAQLNIAKNLVGSALAGSVGGNNAHASNIVTAFFLAHGQDPAQNVESSNCMILMEPSADNSSLHVSATMPSLEVGTVGGGTTLSTQRACLEMLGVAGANAERPGANAARLATLVCSTVLAGELSLNAALASNHLISAHMDLNRKPATAAAAEQRPPPPPKTQAAKRRGFDQSPVQPGLKRQRTSHDQELIGAGRGFAGRARPAVRQGAARGAEAPRPKEPFEAPRLPVP